MKRTFKILIILILASLNLKGQEDDLLSGYSSLISSSSLRVPSLISKKIDNAVSGEIKDKYEYLFFVFINGVNDLGILNFSISDINEMESVGSTDKVAVVVEHNRIARGEEGVQFSNGSNTYFIVKDNPNNREIVSKVIDVTPDGDMGSWRHFARSVKKAIRRFNPDKLIVVLWNHGNGYFGIAYDDVSGNHIKVDEIGKALKDISMFYGRKIDIFAMDACLMQMAEVVSEIKDYAKFIVASEETIPGQGYPYDDILKSINQKSDIKEIAVSMVEEYDKAYNGGKYSYSRGTTLSVVDTSKFSGFINHLNRWVNTVINSDDFKVITSTDVIEKSFFFEKDESMGYILNEETEGILTRNADLVSYLKEVLKSAKNENVKKETQSLIDYITSSLIVYHKGGKFENSQGLSYKDNTYGISIYLPKLRYRSTTYENLTFTKISMWDEFIKKYISDRSGKDSIDIEMKSSLRKSTNNSKIIDYEEEKDDALSNNSFKKENSSGNILGIQKDKIISDKNNDTKLLAKNSLMKDLNSNSQGVYKISENIVARPSIISIRYTNEKTLKPDINELVKLSSSNKNLSSQEDNKKLSNLESVSIDKKNILSQKESSGGVKEKIVEVKNQFIERVNDVIESIFPDKEKSEEYRKKLKEFDVEISSNLSPVYSKKLLEDKKLQKEFSKLDPNKTQKLIAYAGQIIELEKILKRNYSQEDLNSLSKTLETYLDKSRLICELDICIPPEKLVDWMKKNQDFTSSNIVNAEYAIRKWNRIFGDVEYSNVRWAQAGNIVFSSTNWSNMSIKERNVVLERIAKRQVASGIQSGSIVDTSDTRKTQVAKYQELKVAVEKVSKKMLEKNIINSDELAAIKSKPINEQIYILSQLFDRGGLKKDSEVLPYITRINASRTSYTTEVLDESARKYLSNYFSSNIKTEMDKSETSKKLYQRVYGNTKPEINFEYLSSSESQNDGRKIIIDAAIVEQFLRIKGYTKDDLIKNDNARKELMTYLSPLVVREMANIDVSRLKKDNYFPNVRENYAIGLLYQAKYTKEREKELTPIFSNFGGLSDYADKVMIVKRNYEKSDNDRDFIEMAGIKYYSNLPTASEAKSELLLAINKELERRSLLDKKELEKIDKYAIFDLSDINTLSPFEITNYIKDIKTDALLRLKTELTSGRDFKSKIDNYIGS